MSKIDINTVLNQFDLSYNEETNQMRTFGIRFIRRDGILREIFDARKNAKNPRAQTTGEERENSAQKYNLKRHGTIKLYDENSEEYRDVKVAHMVEFRPYNSKKWIPIFH